MPEARPSVEQIAERFWSFVDKGGDDECWPWTGGRASTGYGRTWIAGKGRPATQVAWEIANGKPFPAGLNACHSCDNPICVNPRHIWPGTQLENIKDSIAKGHHYTQPQQAHCKRGHEMTPANRIKAYPQGWRCRECHNMHRRDHIRRVRAERRATNG